MNGTRRILVAATASSLAVLIATAPALGARKASRTGAGGLVPAAIPSPIGPDVPIPFAQKFKFKGKKFKNRKVVDVGVTVNAFGNGPGSNRDLSAVLVDPRGDANTIVDPKGGSAAIPVPRLGSSMLNLVFSDTSLLIPCSPHDVPRFNCNYLQGASEDDSLGTMTGELNAIISPPFVGKGVRGTWKLVWRDSDADPVTTTLGPARLTVKFAKKKKKKKK